MEWRSSKEQQLRSEVAFATGRAMKALEEAHRSERIVGFSLVSNDGLSSLFHVATTWEANEEAVEGLTDEEDIRCAEIWGIPTEWPYREGEEALDGARAIVSELYGEYAKTPPGPSERPAFARHVIGTYLAIFLGLCDARKLFTSETLVVLISSDSGPLLRRLEAAAARRLNDDAVAARWLRAMNYWEFPVEDVVAIGEEVMRSTDP